MRPNDRDTPGPGDRWVVVGGVIFVAGALACVAAVVPLLLGTDPLPVLVYLLALLAPLGFAVALCGLLVGVRARRIPRS
ncbi:hypothetical protein CLV35_3645 [Motilibacter peucedani]|uniref:Uncharacterized protein n=1 Tax=Motilibacter peucedani TaxID=598650 RepID=A0A420XL07_9ACTN|nr:hypothetical protein [Motilibacter peucedani]RKS68517.1 hypothetical protein CLV35_3645 [Motilibacter peucedani]